MVEWNNKTEGINKAGDPFRTIRENDIKRNVIASNDPHDEFDHTYWLIIYSRQRFRYVQQNEGNGWQLLDNARSLYSDCHKCDFVNRYLRDTKMKYNIECFHSTCYNATKYTFSRKTLKTMLTLHTAR